MDYRQAIHYLNSFVNFEHHFIARPGTTEADLDRFRTLLSRLGDPHRSFPVIHVAGTKGKGSTAAMLASILKQAGYRTGLYTSPHLVSVRERIRTNGELISRSEFAAVAGRIAALPSALRQGEEPAFRTVFEHLTAAAFVEFHRRRVDVAVVEAGLGAKLDATVVVDPILSIMTPIGLDHTNILGDTIELITEDKAYIIKPNVPIVTAPQVDEAMAVLVRRAAAADAELCAAPGRGEFTAVRLGVSGASVSTSRQWLNELPVRLGLAGDFQLDNVSTVLTAVEKLRGIGFTIDEGAVYRGLAGVRWRGRLQVMRGRPRIVIDGGHNTIALKAVAQALPQIMPQARSWVAVFGALKGKPVREMLDVLATIARKVYVTPVRFPKSMSAEELLELAQSVKVSAEAKDSAADAFDAARAEVGRGEAVLVVGSLYLVGEVFRHLRRLPPPSPDGKIDDRI